MRLVGYPLREVRRRPGRAALTLAGIAIGVTAVVAVSATIQRTHNAYRYMFETLTGRAALEIVVDGVSGFDPSAVAFVPAVEGVEAAVPVVQMETAVLTSSGPVAALVLGIDPRADGAARDCALRAGQPLDRSDAALLSADFAAQHQLALGSPVRFHTPTGLAEVPVRGLLDPRGAPLARGGAVVLVPLETAQRVFGMGAQINALQIVLRDGVQPPAVRAAIQSRLPPGLVVQPPAARGAVADETLFSAEQALGVMSVVSLVAGGFVILNSMLISVGERRRQLAILRSLGATRRQVLGLVLLEGGLTGVAGAVIGIVAGLALSAALGRIMEGMLGTQLPPLRITAQPLILGGLLGPLVALAAAYVPARRAAARPPLEGLLDLRAPSAWVRRRWQTLLGLLLLSGSLTFAVALIRDWLPGGVAVALLPTVMAGFLVAFMLLIPALSAPTVRLVGWLLGRAAGVAGRLAVRQLRRQPGRTYLTVGVLSIGLVVSIGFGTNLMGSIADIDEWAGQIASFDFFVRGLMPDTGIMAAPLLPEALGQELERIDDVAHVQAVSFFPGRADGLAVVIMAADVDPEGPRALRIISPDPRASSLRFAAGEVVIGTVLARRLGRGPGDTIELHTPRGPRTLRIAGTTMDYTAGGRTVYIQRRVARELFDVPGAHAFLVTARPGRADAAARAAQPICQRSGLQLQSMGDFRRQVDDRLNGVVATLWMLLILVFVVASFGVGNTLTINVLEQTREIAVMRAVAMTRRQVRGMILAQSVCLALVSVVPGVPAGIGLARLMHLSTYPLTGQVTRYREQPLLLGVCALAVLGVALAAALPAARRAARLRVIAALQYE